MEKGRTEKPVTGFRGRSGRSFSAKLKLEQSDEGKWRVEFDEAWATPQPQNGEASQDGGRRTRVRTASSADD
jgi:DNA topoisomerase-3